MNIAIFSISAHDPNAGSVLMAQAAEKRGHTTRISTFQNADDRAWLAESDILILRTTYRTYDDVIAVAEWYKKTNPTGLLSTEVWGIEHSFDKYLAHQVMQAHGIKTPETYLIQTMDDINHLGLDQKLPLIVKPRCENQGRGVKAVYTPEELAKHTQELLYAYGTCIAQYFVAEAEGKDIRAFVIGDEVAASMERRAPEGSVVANLYRGGTAEVISLDEISRALAIKTAQTFKASFAGIDLLRSKDGMTVLEVNISPGFMLAEIADIDLADKIIEHLIAKKEQQ